MEVTNSLWIVTFTALFCVVNSDDIDPIPKQPDDMVSHMQLFYKIVFGIYLGLAILYGIIFLLCYKRCCGPRVTSQGRVISQNRDVKNVPQYTSQKVPYYSPNSPAQYHPPHDAKQGQNDSQQFVETQQLEQYPHPPAYSSPQQQIYP